MEDKPLKTTWTISAATKPANDLILEFQTGSRLRRTTLTRRDAKQLAEDLEQYLRNFRTQSASEKL